MIVGTPGLSPAAQDGLARAVREHLEGIGVNVAATTTAGEIRATQETLFDILVLFLSTMAVLLGVVGGLGLMGTMTINVVERAREIGVLRAVGASDSAVLRIFLTEGMLIGALSWATGALVAIPISKLLARRPGQCVHPSPARLRLFVRGDPPLDRDRARPGDRRQPPALVAGQPPRRARGAGVRMSPEH